MKGHIIVFESVGKAVLKEFQIPELKKDEVLLESDFSAVSAGTERANLMQMPNTITTDGFPMTPGYSSAGRVFAAGSEVSNLKVGDRVLIVKGGHRSYTVQKAEKVFKIEDDTIDLLDASFAYIAIFPLLGVRKLKVELGESVMVAGMGLLGAFAVQIANLSGAVPVLVSDFDPARRELALQLGATAAFAPDEEGLVEKVKNATGGKGPDAVVEVSGSAAAMQQALEVINWEGRISLLGCTRISDVPIDYYKYVHKRGITLVGSHNHTRPGTDSKPGAWTEHDDFRTFMKLVAAGKLKVRPLISEIVSPEAAPEVYNRLAENQNPPLGIVFDWRKLR